MDQYQSRTLRSVRPQEPIQLPEKPNRSPVFWWIFGGVMALLFIRLGVFLIIVFALICRTACARIAAVLVPVGWISK